MAHCVQGWLFRVEEVEIGVRGRSEVAERRKRASLPGSLFGK